MYQFILLIFAYLCGACNFAILFSRAFKIDDPRNYGSGSAGATNVLRSGRKLVALYTVLADCLKGYIVVFGLYRLTHSDLLVSLAAIIVVLGHIYPVFFKFKGGKGVATGFGCILALNWHVALIALVVWILVFILFGISSLAALSSMLVTCIAAYFIMGDSMYFGAVLFISAIVLWRHKRNIFDMLRGNEFRFK